MGNAGTFKSGGSLPSVADDKKAYTGIGSKYSEIKQQFADMSIKDDEDDDEEEEEYGEEDNDDDDFNANELLNLTDYQNKRK